MLKVKFKGFPLHDEKKVQRFQDDKVTVVTLYGSVHLPYFIWQNFPAEVLNWMNNYSNKNIEVHLLNTISSYLMITSVGKAKRAEGEANNPVLGERVAECRAKSRIYRFMKNLCIQFILYYTKKIIGHPLMPPIDPSKEEDSIYSAYQKYIKFEAKEQQHLSELLHSAL